MPPKTRGASLAPLTDPSCSPPLPREPSMSPAERQKLIDRFKKSRQFSLCPEWVANDDSANISKAPLELSPSSFNPLRVCCKVCSANITSGRIRAIITAAEVLQQEPSPRTQHDAPATVPAEAFRELSERVASLTADLAKVTDTNQNNAEQVAALSTELASLREGNNQHASEVANLRSENKELKERLAVAVVDNLSQTQPAGNAPVDATNIEALLREFTAQQAALAAETRASADESAKAIEGLKATVNSIVETQKDTSAQKAALPQNRVPNQTTPTTPTGTDTASDTTAVQRARANNAVAMPDQAPAIVTNAVPPPQIPPQKPSFLEMARRNLPATFTLHDSYEEEMQESIHKFRENNFVRRSEPPRPFAPRVDNIGSSRLVPVYGSNMAHQPVACIIRGLRTILPPQAARGFSLFGRDCFELLVEEAFIDYTKAVLRQLGFTISTQKAPLAFATARGSPILDDARLQRCAKGAAKRWQKSLEGCPYPPAQDWYYEQLKALAEKHPDSIPSAAVTEL